MAASILEAYADLKATDLLAALHQMYMRQDGKPDFDAIAKDLGVTRRAVERWYTSAAQQRKPGPQSLEKMKRILPKRFRVHGTYTVDSPKRRQAGQAPDTRTRTFTIPPDRDLELDEAEEIYDLAHSGEDDAEDTALQLLFFLYGFEPDEYEDLDISIEL